MGLDRRVALLTIIVACLRVAPAGAQEAAKSSFEGWGDAVNPDRDCRFRPESGARTLTITVPAKAHLLSAEGRHPKLNAPRILRAVKGDFAAQVTVLGEVRPGPGATSPYAPYHGAGLLIWRDAKNYIRLERAAFIKDGAFSPYVNFEQRKDGRLASSEGGPSADAPLVLRLERLGGEITGSYHTPGGPTKSLPPLAAAYPEALRVGILAVNAADNPLDAVFQDFAVELKEKPAAKSP